MKEKIWENMGYSILVLCLIGQITVGYIYLFAQFIYLTSNIIGVIRDFQLKRPIADKVRNFAFLAITAALIILRLWGI